MVEKPLVVSDGKHILQDAATGGDEPYMLAANLPGVCVLVDRNRVKAGRYAISRFGCDTLILDDGFQYQKLKHSIEVAELTGLMAAECGCDVRLAKRAGLLHDIGKAFPHDVEGTHVQIGVNAAKKYKESREVIHAIEAHHNDVEPKTIIAVLVQAADAISAARPGARREDLENYTKRLEKLEEIAKEFRGVDKAYAIQAGRELRVMVKPEEVNDEGMKVIARDMAAKIREEVKYPGQIKVNLIRESRAVDYAK